MSYFLILIMLFNIIFQPPIGIRINVLFIQLLLSLYIIFKNSLIFSKIIKTQKIIKMYLFLMILSFHLLLLKFIYNSPNSDVSFTIYWIVIIIPNILSIVILMKKRQYTIYDLLRSLIIVAFIQSIIVLFTFISPAFKDFTIRLLINSGASLVFQELSSHRMYGLASNLTYTVPIYQSFSSVLSLYLAIKYDRKYYVFFLPIGLSAFINSRFSLFIFIVGLLILIMFEIKKIKPLRVMRIIIVICISAVFLNYTYNKMEVLMPSTYFWIKEGLLEFENFINPSKRPTYSYFNYINDPTIYKLPEGLNRWFGNGIRVMQENVSNTRSDIGYINDIWLGGYVLSLLIYIHFFYGLLKIYNAKIHDDPDLLKFISVYLFLIFLLSNIKGYIFAVNSITTSFYLIYIWTNFTNEELKL